MGCSSSKEISPRRSHRGESGLARRISEAILLKKKEHESDEHKPTLEKILLKFDKMREVLTTIKRVFKAHSEDGGRSITKEGLHKVMSRLHNELCESDINDLFSFVDIDTSNSIDFKEFLVSLSVCMVLGKITADGIGTMSKSNEAPTPMPTIRKSNLGKDGEEGLSSLASYKTEAMSMLSLILSAYLLFDPEGKGTISRKQVDAMLEEHEGAASSGGSGKASQQAQAHARHVNNAPGGQSLMSAALWSKMDWDLNGTVDFAEFVYQFVHWIEDVDDLEDA
jgi:Ca2+-binding EF-hand superfamily protein